MGSLQIARDARRLADDHEQAATAIINLADEALNASRDAMRLLTETVAKKKNNTAILQVLWRKKRFRRHFMVFSKMAASHSKRQHIKLKMRRLKFKIFHGQISVI